MTDPLSPDTHALLSPSRAHRWINCHGSVKAEVPFPDSSSKYADEGTAAHYYAAVCLEHGLDADALGARWGWPEWATARFNAPPECMDWPLTADMAEHVQTYVDYVRGLWLFCDETWIERKAVIDPALVPLPDPTVGQGTSDAGGVEYGARTLHVSDLKYGRGVLVEPQENDQFRLYALGAYSALTHDQRMQLKTVKYHVVQPRADHPHGPCRTWEEPIDHLLRWALNVMAPAAHAVMGGATARRAGDHCKFCRAKGACDTFRGKAFEAMPFTPVDLGSAAPLPLPGSVAKGSVALPVPLTTDVKVQMFTPEQAAAVYFGLERLEDWIKAYREFIFHEVSAGREIPGVAVKRKRTSRKWLDDGLVADALREQLDDEVIFDRKLVTPAAAEKLCKHYKVPFPEHLVVKDEGDLTLCAADDPGALTVAPGAATKFTIEELP